MIGEAVSKIENQAYSLTYPAKFRGIGDQSEFRLQNSKFYLFNRSNLVWEVPQTFRHQECRGRGCPSCMYQGITQKLWFPCLCQVCHRPFEILAPFLLADTTRYVNSLGNRVLFLYHCPQHQSVKHARRALMNGEELYRYSD
jgi:hypothetical protein